MKIKGILKKSIFSLTFFICSLFFLYGESFRVSKVHTSSVSPVSFYEEVFKLGINDSLAITIPENSEYMEGIEIKFIIPDSIAYYTNSVSCSIYKNLKPTPKSSQIDYDGDKCFTRNLPNKLSWVLQIPLTEDNSLKSNNYIQTTDPITDSSNNVVLVKLSPAMRKLPEEISNSIVSVSVKPILANKGKFNLSLIAPDGQLNRCSVFIDDKMVDFENRKDIYLTTGIHDVSILSESYRNELRTIRIEQAGETTLSVELKSIDPTMIITIPEGTSAYLDGKKCKNIGKEFKISEGEHTLKFTLGNYEIIRTIDAVKGKTYNATFALDLQISEN